MEALCCIRMTRPTGPARGVLVSMWVVAFLGQRVNGRGVTKFLRDSSIKV